MFCSTGSGDKLALQAPLRASGVPGAERPPRVVGRVMPDTIDALSEEPDVAEDPEEDVKDGVSRCCDNGMFEQSDNK